MKDYSDVNNWSKEEWKEAIEAGSLAVATFTLVYGIVWLAAIIGGEV